MISILTFKGIPEQIEIVADEQGIDELIDYLMFVKRSRDHMHLIIDSEIDPFPISSTMKEVTTYAKSVRIEFSETSQWEV
ncbi:MAG: hypothetical protein H6570_19020 [Lewinellaceae bacterium]|nr:hypothetical protein [Lewinellaceae bacterium]